MNAGDGKGYPGNVDEEKQDESAPLTKGVPKKDAEIPITARIVALADVYDALISKRVYKDAWNEDEVLKYIAEQSAKQFDPEVVTAFQEIYPVINAIREKYSD